MLAALPRVPRTLTKYRSMNSLWCRPACGTYIYVRTRMYGTSHGCALHFYATDGAKRMTAFSLNCCTAKKESYTIFDFRSLLKVQFFFKRFPCWHYVHACPFFYTSSLITTTK